MQEWWARARRRWERVSPRAHDVVFVAVPALVQVVLVNRDLAFLGGATAGTVIGVVGSAALWWRRRYPVAVMAVCLAAAVLSINAVLPLAALFSLAIRRRDVVLVASSAAAWIVFQVPTLTNGAGLATTASVGGALLVLSVALAGAYLGARRDLVVSLTERATRAEAERELRAEQARLAERARIAREMHDVLAHKVSLIALHAGGLEVNPPTDRAAVVASAGLIRTTSREALEDLRTVLGALRSDTTATGVDLAPQPTLADVPRLVAASRAAGVQVRMDDSTADGLPVTDAVGRTAYRVVQEGLTNVHKHARCAATTVRIACGADDLSVEVGNERPVAAGSLLPGSGAGLVGLRERVELHGGRLHAGPSADGGWCLLAVLPREERSR